MIALEQVVQTVEDLVDEKGSDYVYEHPTYTIEHEDGSTELDVSGYCVYSNQQGEPSCIVGHVASRLTPEFFRKLREGEWSTKRPLSSTVYDLMQSFLNAGYTFEAAEFLAAAQNTQDGGGSWGEARDKAHEHVEKIKKEMGK